MMTPEKWREVKELLGAALMRPPEERAAFLEDIARRDPAVRSEVESLLQAHHDSGDFIEEPLRTYSSGMMMRLAFAVAVHLDPELLIIDEVLAVGDHAFQAKCAEKIFELKNSGTTLLCVSHSAQAVQSLCSRALWLDHGELLMDGPASEVLDAYEGRLPSKRS
jgi:ABC-type polysaccharide/polyol phosphate transport system ATPase subunit